MSEEVKDTTTERPQMGEWRDFKVSAEKYRNVDYSRTHNRVRGEWRRKPTGKPGRGMYVGYRTVQEGAIDYLGSEEGSVMVADKWLEMWMFVTHPRSNPVYVFPEDVLPAESGKP